MKRTLALILALVMIVGMIPMSVFADETTPTLKFTHDVTDVSTLKAGDKFTVTATLTNNPGFAAFQFDLDWDNTVVQFDGFSTEEFRGVEFLVSDVIVSSEYDQTTGVIVVGESENITTSGKLFVANFTVIKEGDADITYKKTWPDFELKTAAGTDVAHTVNDSDLEQLTIKHTHSYSAVVTAPTCTEGGYTTYTCTAGDDTYVTERVPALGHTNVNGTCSVCGESLTVIPEGAKFIEITTDKGEIVNVTEMDGFYKVEVPYGTTSLQVTYPEALPVVDQFGYVKTKMTGFDGVSDDGYEKTQKDGKITVGLHLVKSPASPAPIMLRLINLDGQFSKKVTICMNDGSVETFALTYMLGEGEYLAELPVPENCIGYTVSGSPIAKNGYTFTVALDEGYQPDSNFAVKVNGETVEDAPGEITLDTVTGNIAVTVEGVSKEQNNTTDVIFNVDLTGTPDGMWGDITIQDNEYNSFSESVASGKKSTAAITAKNNQYSKLRIYEIKTALITGWEVNGTVYPEGGKQYVGDLCIWNKGSYMQVEYSGTTPITVNIKPVLAEHNEHTYDQTVQKDKYLKAEATCQHGTEYYKSCICGEFAETAETFSWDSAVACVYENGVCKWCGTAEPEPEETTSFFTVTLNDEAKTPVTIYQHGEVYCNEYEEAVPKIIAYVPEGTTSVVLSAEGSLNIIADEQDYLGALENPVLDLTEGYTFYGVFPGDWSDVCHLYIEEEEDTPAPEQPVSNPIQSVEAKNPLLNKTSAEDAAPVYSVTLMSGVTEDLLLDITGKNPDKEATQQLTWSSTKPNVAWVENGKLFTGTVTESTDVILTATVPSEAAAAAIDGESSDALITLNVTVNPVDAGYTVTMGADMTVVADETILIPVTVNHTNNEDETEDNDVQNYKSYEFIFQYDPTVLTLNNKSAENDAKDVTIVDNNGTVTVRRYGDALSVGTAAITLEFTAKKTGEANVKLTSAKVGTSDDAQDQNIPTAQVVDNITLITVSGYTVQLPEEDFEGERVIAPGESYTFEAKDKNYTYEVKATIDGEEITVNSNEDGTSFTIPEGQINGNVVIEIANKEGKKFEITLNGESLAHESGITTEGEKTYVQYMTPYTAKLTKKDHFIYDLNVTVNGETVAHEYNSETGIITIPGNLITGPVVIDSGEQESDKHNVEFEGAYASHAKYEGESAVYDGEDFSFTIETPTGLVIESYQVSYKLGTATEYTALGAVDGTYTIENVTAALTIKIEGTSDLEVEVNEYVKLDGKTVFLVTATQTLPNGKNLAYNSYPMYLKNFQVEGKTVQQYAFLVMVESGTLTVEDASKQISVVEAASTVLEDTFNVNESTALDINDAQLVYDMYNNVYQTIAPVGMQKFLRADVNGSKNINVQDAAAIVIEILK